MFNSTWSALTQSFHTIYQVFAPTTSNTPEDYYFFQQLQGNEHYQTYRHWRKDIKHALEKALTVKQHPAVIQQQLDAWQQEKNIISPAYYAQLLNKLYAEPVHQSVAERARALLQAELKSSPEKAYIAFLRDVFFYLVELVSFREEVASAQQALSFYQGLVPNVIYQAVIDQFNSLQPELDKLTHRTDFAVLPQSIVRRAMADFNQILLEETKPFSLPIVEEEISFKHLNGQKAKTATTLNWFAELSSRLSNGWEYLKRHPDHLIVAATAGMAVWQSRESMSSLSLPSSVPQTITLLGQTALSYRTMKPWITPGQAFGINLLSNLHTLMPAQAQTNGVIDLSSLNGINGWTINGENADGLLGSSVGSGDINGDGYDDVIVGAYRANPPGERIEAGVTYVVFGHSNGFVANMELTSLNGSNGFKIYGAAAGDWSGSAVSSGDINGDGVTDVLIGARRASPPDGRTNAGIIYVVFGQRLAGSFAESVELSNLNGSNGFKVYGAAANDDMGGVTHGDINGDGIDDLIIRGFAADPNSRLNAGAAYVIFGRRTAYTASFELSSLNGQNGFAVYGAAAGDYLGTDGSSADINGDGFDDVIVSAYFARPGGVQNAGITYVIFGRSSNFAAILDLATYPLDGQYNGFAINGTNAFDAAGIDVSHGDINGDGIADVLISALGADHPTSNASNVGAVYVIFGKNNTVFPESVGLSSLTGSTGFVIYGAYVEDALGSDVDYGDVNGDGIDDVIIGASAADPDGRINAGAAYIIFGHKGSFAAKVDLSRAPENGNNWIRINGVAGGDGAGVAVNHGDINGDTIQDIIIGAYQADPGDRARAGSAYVVLGRSLSASSFNQTLTYTQNIVQALPPMTVSAPLGYSNINLSLTLNLSPVRAGNISPLSNYATFPGVWEISDTEMRLNQILSNLQFEPANNFNASVQITIQLIDVLNNRVNGAISLHGISVNNNQAPKLLNSLAKQEVIVDERFDIPVPDNTFVDPEGDVLTFSAKTKADEPLPDWIQFDSANRRFTGTAKNSGIYEFGLFAHDSANAQAKMDLSIEAKLDGTTRDIIAGVVSGGVVMIVGAVGTVLWKNKVKLKKFFHKDETVELNDIAQVNTTANSATPPASTPPASAPASPSASKVPTPTRTSLAAP